jgi:RNA polymerase sigma-70 factor (ECF subfamily)
MALRTRPSNYELDHWLKRIANGDPKALENLYQATRSGVYAYALSIMQNACDAQDVLHDCYIRVWNNAGSYQGQDKPMAWIITITRNLCFNKLQQNKRYISADEVFRPSNPDLDAESTLVLRSCMQTLSEEERQIVVLHAVSGCTFREIAEMLRSKTPTVASKYRRAIQKLRDNF